MKNYFLNADFRTGTVSKSYGVTSGVLSEGVLTASEIAPEWDVVVAIGAGIITGDVLITNPLVGASAAVPAPPVDLQAKRMLRFDIANDFNPAQDDFSAAVGVKQTITDVVPAITGKPVDVSFWVYSQGGGQIRVNVTKVITRTDVVSTTVLDDLLTVDPGWTQVRRGIYLNHEIPNHPTLGILNSTSLIVAVTTEEYSATSNSHNVALNEHVVLCLTGFCLGASASSFSAGDELETSRVLPNPSVYRALVSQTGTDAPVVTVLENTLGAINWTRGGAGIARMTAATPVFTADKTFITVGPSASTAAETGVRSTLTHTSTTVIDLTTYNLAGAATDALLKKTAVEILVYP